MVPRPAASCCVTCWWVRLCVGRVRRLREIPLQTLLRRRVSKARLQRYAHADLCRDLAHARPFASAREESTSVRRWWWTSQRLVMAWKTACRVTGRRAGSALTTDVVYGGEGREACASVGTGVVVVTESVHQLCIMSRYECSKSSPNPCRFTSSDCRFTWCLGNTGLQYKVLA